MVASVKRCYKYLCCLQLHPLNAEAKLKSSSENKVIQKMEEIHFEKGPVTIVTCYGALAVINAGAACSRNIQPLLIIRFIPGDFGSSPSTNTCGQIADMFGPRLAGLAMTLFVAALFIGSAVGPLIRRPVTEAIG
jgi:hypothetical protein